MNIKAAAKTVGAILYRNRAKIETITGLVAIAVGTGIIISKAREAADVSYELESKFDDIHQRDENDDWLDKSERSATVMSALLYGAKGYSKAYWLGVTLEIGGAVLITISDITQSKELSATSALLAATSATLSAVKERVIADQGEEKWQEYLLGPQFTTVDVMPDGTIIQTTEPIDNPNRQVNLPPHCYMFDEANINWEKDPQMNRNYLEDHLRWLNQRLDTEESLFTNDILRDLDMPIVKSGWTSGIMKWSIDPKTGDKYRNYLSFGLDAKNSRAQAFRDGIEPSIILQLNVEDNIIDQLDLSLI